MLEVEDISVSFGSINAVKNVSFTVDSNQICGVIGPNGAGKTTLFNALSGLVRTTGGSIRLNGHMLDARAPHRSAYLGLGRTFQNLALFESMTVADNVATGGFVRSKPSIVADILRLPASIRAESERQRAVAQLIDMFDLGRYKSASVASLPFGIRKRVEFARALASKPTLLLLDEPAAGLNHDELSALERMIRDARSRFGVSILLVEHHMGFVMRLCDKIVAMNFGTKIDEGTPRMIQESPAVVNAYLGEPSKHAG